MQGDPDATMPVQGRPDPTMPVQTGMGGDPTVPVTQPGYGGGTGGPGGTGGDGYDDDGEEGDRRKLWMIAGGVLVLGLLIGALVAILASGGGDDNASTTTSSSTTTTSSTTPTTTAPSTTTPTTQQAAPSILQFNANPSPYTCPGSGQIALSWSTQNTSGITLTIDGGAPYGSYGPTGNLQAPFTCPATQHTYVLIANGTNGQKPQQPLVVQAVTPPSGP